MISCADQLTRAFVVPQPETFLAISTVLLKKTRRLAQLGDSFPLDMREAVSSVVLSVERGFIELVALRFSTIIPWLNANAGDAIARKIDNVNNNKSSPFIATIINIGYFI
jgi:hypothetical protein